MPSDPVPDWVLSERRAFGERVKQLREERGLSIDQLAQAAFIDRKSVIRTEKARHATSIDNLHLIASALGVPPWLLLRDRSDG